MGVETFQEMRFCLDEMKKNCQRKKYRSTRATRFLQNLYFANSYARVCFYVDEKKYQNENSWFAKNSFFLAIVQDTKEDTATCFSFHLIMS